MSVPSITYGIDTDGFVSLLICVVWNIRSYNAGPATRLIAHNLRTSQTQMGPQETSQTQGGWNLSICYCNIEKSTSRSLNSRSRNYNYRFFLSYEKFFNLKWQNFCHLQIGKTFDISKCNFSLVWNEI